MANDRKLIVSRQAMHDRRQRSIRDMLHRIRAIVRRWPAKHAIELNMLQQEFPLGTPEFDQACMQHDVINRLVERNDNYHEATKMERLLVEKLLHDATVADQGGRPTWVLPARRSSS